MTPDHKLAAEPLKFNTKTGQGYYWEVFSFHEVKSTPTIRADHRTQLYHNLDLISPSNQWSCKATKSG